MAKSRSFFGLRRGSTKSFTFSILGGQQITKDRVSEVRNPRTYPQQFQRAKFASMVKYFKQLPKGLLTYAYEDKKATESYYNAFMRHNANRICTYLADQNAASAVLATGDVEISAGTLGVLTLDRGFIVSSSGESVIRFVSNIATNSGAVRTIGTVAQLSQILISQGRFAAGDIVNVIVQVSPTVYGIQTAPYIVSDTPNATPTTAIMSCIVDTSDNTSIKSHFNDDLVSEATKLVDVGEHLAIEIATGDEAPCYNAAFVVSRKSQSGVKVTTSNMTCPETWPLEKMRYDAYAPLPSRPGVAPQTNWTELVAQSYEGAEGEAILQGGLVTDGEIVLAIESTTQLPHTFSNIHVKFTKPTTLAELAEKQLTFSVGQNNYVIYADGYIKNPQNTADLVCMVAFNADNTELATSSVQSGHTTDQVTAIAFAQ